MLLSWRAKRTRTEQKLLHKKLLVFDLDGTLTLSKSCMQPNMAKVLGALLRKYHVAIISGCGYEQMLEQFAKPLLMQIRNSNLFNGCVSRIHLLPMSGTSYYKWNKVERRFEPVYQENMSLREKAYILNAFDEALNECHIPIFKTYGDVEEDRGSQVTFSLLGQQAPLQEKEKLDPNATMRQRIRDKMIKKLPGFEVRIGGTTSIDVTYEGMDKAYGIIRLLKESKKYKKDTIFIGDSLFEGGNDESVKRTRIDCIEVSHVGETLEMLAILAAKILHKEVEKK